MPELTNTPEQAQSEALVQKATSEAQTRLAEVDAQEDPRADAAAEDADA